MLVPLTIDIVLITAAAAGFGIRIGNINDRARDVVGAFQKVVGPDPVLKFDITWTALLSGDGRGLWTRTLATYLGDPLEVLVAAVFYDLLAEADPEGLGGGGRADEGCEADDLDVARYLEDGRFD